MPMYTLVCPACGRTTQRFIRYDDYEQYFGDGAAGYPSHCDESGRTEHLRRWLEGMPAVHFKGYGFYTTDTRHPDEKYAFDHFDGSGDNPEKKAMDRRISDPQSTAPTRDTIRG